MHERPDLIVCEECDAVHRRPVLAHAEVARCLRCGAELERDTGSHVARLLPLTVASLIMFVIANSFPIVQIELQGLTSETTLFGAVMVLNGEGMSLVAMLVLSTTILFPLVQMLVLLYLLLPSAHVVNDADDMHGAHDGRRPGVKLLLRLMQIVRPWGMVEVFLLGVLVALVKLSNMAAVVPGVALWAFGALTILLTVVVSFNPRYLWRILVGERRNPGEQVR
ncbi:paraquat-inducible protein A [Herbaspirillum lusitanum]|uniref:paraquat-inducible protein A n=1 Tax=Herbaspirillum lusitanum TaxID=213312 RepID=UPI002237E4C3|nr:paraquat-inducible protein A [Herbaspirillum lusitanum]MCW5300138.1 paraquat-inducible protein A [Herbaspirillum lusitanum]